MSAYTFRKVGSAYRCPLENGQALWLRRGNGRWSLINEHFTPLGVRSWSTLGTYSSLAAGKADACALLGQEVTR